LILRAVILIQVSWVRVDVLLPMFLSVHSFDSITARNVLLLTLVADNHPSPIVWNIFFHMYLDNHSHTILVEHCKKLVTLSDSPQTWNASLYGTTIKMSTEHTLVELRRHWSLYVRMQDLPANRINAIRNSFTTLFKSTLKKSRGDALSVARSAGPLMMKAIPICSAACRQYWAKGVTFSSPQQIANATILNPTFVYSRAGEGCSVHYGTDPLSPFHLATLFGNKKGTITVSDLVGAATAQFKDWCSAFYKSTSPNAVKPPVVRFFLGDAIAACNALHAFGTTGTLNLGVPVSQWHTQLIQLNKVDYVSGHAPAIFNVIDTSNLNDHIGLFNVLIASVPLLSAFTPSSVLYTESLLFKGQDATKEFTERLYTNLTVMALLIGICPVDYLSGFTTRSNIHELAIHMATRGEGSQFHQVTTWKFPVSGDAYSVQLGDKCLPPVFDARQLGTLLYDMYREFFEHEDSRHFKRRNEDNMIKAISHSNLIHYIREGFVLFLKLVRSKLRYSDEQWLEVMDRFFDLKDADKSMPMDTLNHHDFCAQLRRHGVFTAAMYREERLPKSGRLSSWDVIPPFVRVILVVPREKLAVLEDPTVATPLLYCGIEGNWTLNIFSAVHAAFGKAIPMGTKARPWVVFEEDPEGMKGTSPLVTSFIMPTVVLLLLEPMENMKIDLRVRSTVGTVPLIQKLGLSLKIFAAPLMDESAVHILPEQPLPFKKMKLSPATSPTGTAPIGHSGASLIELDEQCELVVSLTSRVSVDNEQVKGLFTSGTVPQISQISPCTLNLAVGQHVQTVIYPFSVVGSQYKLRVARKSLYIEVSTFTSNLLNFVFLQPLKLLCCYRSLFPRSVH
jgi:hypothetical protein